VQPVDLNLATRPFKNDTLPWVGFLVGLLVLGYVTWWNVVAFAENRTLLAEHEESQSHLLERMDELERRKSEAVRRIDGYDLDLIAVKSDKANEVIRWKAFSWTRLFNLLEEVVPHNVQMTSIHPAFGGGPGGGRDPLTDPELVIVAVEGVGKTLNDFLEFERTLIRSPHFDRPEPERHTVDENTKEVVFRLRFVYDPRVPIGGEPGAPEGVEQAPVATGPALVAEASAGTLARPALEPTAGVIEPAPEGFPAEPVGDAPLATDRLEPIVRAPAEPAPSAAATPTAPPVTPPRTMRPRKRPPRGAPPTTAEQAPPVIERPAPEEPWRQMEPVDLGEGASPDDEDGEERP
jgi:hypothetical protein